MTPYVKEQESYKEAERKIEAELQELSIRLNNSVPFFNFRCQANTFTYLCKSQPTYVFLLQGHMLWDTTIASNVGYISALFYNQNNVASMASGVTLQLEREVGRELCAMVGYRVTENVIIGNNQQIY